MTDLEEKACKDCGIKSWFAEAEDPKRCPACGSASLS